MIHMIKDNGTSTFPKKHNNLKINESLSYCGIISKKNDFDCYIGRVDCLECKRLYFLKNK